MSTVDAILLDTENAFRLEVLLRPVLLLAVDAWLESLGIWRELGILLPDSNRAPERPKY